MTYEIYFKTNRPVFLERDHYSVPVIARSYDEAIQTFLKYFGRYGYTYLEAIIVDYEEW